MITKRRLKRDCSADNSTALPSGTDSGGAPAPLITAPTPSSSTGDAAQHTDTGMIAAAAFAGAGGVVAILVLTVTIRRWMLRKRAQRLVAFDDGPSRSTTLATPAGQQPAMTSTLMNGSRNEMRRERHKSELLREEQLQAVQAAANRRQEKWDFFHANIVQ